MACWDSKWVMLDKNNNALIRCAGLVTWLTSIFRVKEPALPIRRDDESFSTLWSYD